MTDTLSPSYLEIDFNTYKEKIITQLRNSPIFTDYNYEGANITILIELMAYIAELTTYYVNKLAANTYIDTADVYENIHRIANMMGYYPMGHVSSKSTVTFTISEEVSSGDYTVSVGDTLRVVPWTQLKSNITVNDEAVYFVVTNEVVEVVDAFPFVIESIPVKQGIVRTFEFTGTDLIDNKIYLPFLDFSFDDDISDDYPSIQVTVNGDTWTRVSDFYDYMSGYYTEDEVYMFIYGKYENYYIEFSDSREIPGDNDIIQITVIETIGKDGDVAATTTDEVWEAVDTELFQNSTTGKRINTSNYGITHPNPSLGAADPETIEAIRKNAKATLFTQYRNVTATDYVTYLENRSDVTVAKVWGEQDIAPSGSIEDYNKVYISVIPTTWGTSSINYAEISLDGCTEILKVPTSYVESWKEEIAAYLERRKMLATYEIFVVPELVYFRFNMGLGIKRNYVFNSVLADIKSKLCYYFACGDRGFGETVDFDDIEEYIKDISNVSTSDSFLQCKGIDSLVIRDIDYYDILTSTWKNPYDYGSVFYPKYATTVLESWEENNLRSIYLGPYQFPLVHVESCIILQRRYGNSVT